MKANNLNILIKPQTKMTKLSTKVRMLQTEKCFAKYLYRNINVLDIGAGNGYISKYFIDKFGCRMHCSDIVNYMESDPPFTLIKNNTLSFKKDAFDVAIMNVQEKMLKEAVRVAKKVLIVETNRTLIALILDTIFSKIQCFNMPVPYTHRNSESWKNLFEKLGIVYEDVKVGSHWYYPLQHLFFAISKASKY